MSATAKLGEFLLLGLPVMAATAMVGAAAVWTAGGRGHWFFRASVLVGLIASSLLVFPPQAMLGLAVEAGTVIVGLKGARESRAWRLAWQDAAPHAPDEMGRWQFSLRDLLLGAVLGAVVAGLLGRLSAIVWADAGLISFGGVFFGVVVLVAVFSFYEQRRRNAGKPGWVPGVRTIHSLWIGGLLGLVVAAVVESKATAWTQVFAIIVGKMSFFALLVALVGWYTNRKHRKSQAADGNGSVGSPPRPLARRWRILLAVWMVFLLTVACLGPSSVSAIYLASVPTMERPVPLPDAPGYQALVKAADVCVRTPCYDVFEASPGALANSVERNAVAIDAARRALDQECYVTLRYTQADGNRDFSKLRDLACALAAAGRMAGLNGQTEDALDHYLDVLRYARAIARNGLLIDALIAAAAEYQAMAGINEIGDQLSSDQIRMLLGSLRRADDNRERMVDVLDRERVWAAHVHNARERMVEFLFRGSGDCGIEDAVNADMNCQARMRILICELAVRLYVIDHGHQPDTLAELVPDCLPELPNDPYTDEPLRYRCGNSGHVIYSVGPDKTDDGGQPIKGGEYGDILLDDICRTSATKSK